MVFSVILSFVMNEKVSIVIPTYNRKGEIKKLLDRFRKEDFSSDSFEVLVIDDCSSDGTRAFLESYKAPFRLVNIFHNENRGSAASRNDGVRTANNDIILFLDDDLIPEKGIITNHIKCHHNKRCAVIGNIKYRETKSTRWISRYLSSRGVHKIKRGAKIPFKCFWTSNASIRKENLINAGLFDEDFKGAGGEDTEIAYRLEKRGIEFLYAKEALCYHRPVSLQELLSKQESFSKNGLPLLIDRDDIFKEVFKLNLLRNPFVRFSLSPFLFLPIYALTNLIKGFYIPAFILDYILLYKRTEVVRSLHLK